MKSIQPHKSIQSILMVPRHTREEIFEIRANRIKNSGTHPIPLKYPLTPDECFPRPSLADWEASKPILNTQNHKILFGSPGSVILYAVFR
jgi:hypothetical protein